MTEQPDLNEKTNDLEHSVAATLRASAYCSFTLACAGLVLEFLKWSHAQDILRLAVIFLLATPALRIAVMVVVFFRRRENKYALIAFAVLAVLIGSALLGVRLE
jgi:uncharacterized membrane protein